MTYTEETQAVSYGRQFADFYDRLFPPGAGAEATAAWLAALHPRDGAPALELGIGTGRIALPLAERVGEVVGVDASPDMLDVLRDELDRRPLPIEPVLADIRDYDDDRRYGLVYACAARSRWCSTRPISSGCSTPAPAPSSRAASW